MAAALRGAEAAHPAAERGPRLPRLAGGRREEGGGEPLRRRGEPASGGWRKAGAGRGRRRWKAGCHLNTLRLARGKHMHPHCTAWPRSGIAGTFKLTTRE